MPEFAVLHDGSQYESSFEVSLVEAPNALTAARRVHKKDHNGTGEYTYFVLPSKDLQVIQARMPKEASFTPVSIEDAKIPVLKVPKEVKK